MKHVRVRISKLALALIIGCMSLVPQPALALSGSNFSAGRIIDDQIFYNNNSMSANDIQNFLNSKVPICDTWGTQPYGGTTRAAYSQSKGVSTPFTCLKDYKEDEAPLAANAFCNALPGGNAKSAAQIIKDIADACGINPQVLLVLLQKEQALVTDDWPWPIQYQRATGYACPDSGSCDTAYYGFFNQVYNAAKQFQRYTKQPNSFGYVNGISNYIQYNPNTVCGGSMITIQNQATANLYNYTPYQPNVAALNNLYGTGDSCSAYGNRNFWRLFTDWFGTTVTSNCAFETGQPVITDTVLRKSYPHIDSGELVIYTGTSTSCIEAHTWGDNFSSWLDHTATNQRTLVPNDCAVSFADITGDGIDESLLYCWNNTATGKVEFHIWDPSMRTWSNHIISGLPSYNPADITLEFADLNASGKEVPVFVAYRNTGSTMVELHVMNNDLTTWRSHIITNLPAADPAKMQVEFADINGDRIDEAMAIGIADTSTGNFEFHVWNQGQWSWQSHTVSNQALVDMYSSSITFGNFSGNGPDQAALILKHATGSGRIEFHVWNPGFTSWQAHNASNQQTFF